MDTSTPFRHGRSYAVEVSIHLLVLSFFGPAYVSREGHVWGLFLQVLVYWGNGSKLLSARGLGPKVYATDHYLR